MIGRKGVKGKGHEVLGGSHYIRYQLKKIGFTQLVVVLLLQAMSGSMCSGHLERSEGHEHDDELAYIRLPHIVKKKSKPRLELPIGTKRVQRFMREVPQKVFYYVVGVVERPRRVGPEYLIKRRKRI